MSSVVLVSFFSHLQRPNEVLLHLPLPRDTWLPGKCSEHTSPDSWIHTQLNTQRGIPEQGHPGCTSTHCYSCWSSYCWESRRWKQIQAQWKPLWELIAKRWFHCSHTQKITLTLFLHTSSALVPRRKNKTKYIIKCQGSSNTRKVIVSFT